MAQRALSARSAAWVPAPEALENHVGQNGPWFSATVLVGILRLSRKTAEGSSQVFVRDSGGCLDLRPGGVAVPGEKGRLGDWPWEERGPPSPPSQRTRSWKLEVDRDLAGAVGPRGADRIRPPGASAGSPQTPLSLPGTSGLHSAVSDPDSDARPPALGHLGHTASLKRGSGFQSGRGDGKCPSTFTPR